MKFLWLSIYEIYEKLSEPVATSTDRENVFCKLIWGEAGIHETLYSIAVNDLVISYSGRKVVINLTEGMPRIFEAPTPPSRCKTHIPLLKLTVIVVAVCRVGSTNICNKNYMSFRWVYLLVDTWYIRVICEIVTNNRSIVRHSNFF